MLHIFKFSGIFSNYVMSKIIYLRNAHAVLVVLQVFVNNESNALAGIKVSRKVLLI